jgi:guanylate kinase
VIISGPAGVGKTTICRALSERLENAYFSVSMTSRPRAEGELDGREYVFVSRREFEKAIENGRLLEHAEVFGNLYGTPRQPVERALQAGKTVILEIDIQGGRQVAEQYPGSVTVFILPPNTRQLVQRIRGRARDDSGQIRERLSESQREIAEGIEGYRFAVVNDDLETAVNEVIEIVKQPAGERQ